MFLTAHNDDGEVYRWTFTDFEQHTGHRITWSMYRSLCSYVEFSATFMECESIDDGSYKSQGVEAEAIDYYYGLPLSEREAYTEQETIYADQRVKQAQEKLKVASTVVPEYSVIYNDVLTLYSVIQDKYEDEIDFWISCVECPLMDIEKSMSWNEQCNTNYF